MDIRPQDLKGKPKEIGSVGKNKVFLVSTTGGFQMVVASKGPKFETLGVGSHRAIAMELARKREPNIVFNTLSKADYVDPAHFQMYLPQWETVTEAIRKLQGY